MPKCQPPRLVRTLQSNPPHPPTPAAFLPSKGEKHRHAHAHTHVRVHMRTLTAPLTAEPMQDRACLEAQDSDFTPPKAPPPPPKLSPSAWDPDVAAFRCRRPHWRPRGTVSVLQGPALGSLPPCPTWACCGRWVCWRKGVFLRASWLADEPHSEALFCSHDPRPTPSVGTSEKGEGVTPTPLFALTFDPRSKPGEGGGGCDGPGCPVGTLG